jgi:hypothetical protein
MIRRKERLSTTEGLDFHGPAGRSHNLMGKTSPVLRGRVIKCKEWHGGWEQYAKGVNVAWPTRRVSESSDAGQTPQPPKPGK